MYPAQPVRFGAPATLRWGAASRTGLQQRHDAPTRSATLTSG